MLAAWSQRHEARRHNKMPSSRRLQQQQQQQQSLLRRRRHPSKPRRCFSILVFCIGITPIIMCFLSSAVVLAFVNGGVPPPPLFKISSSSSSIPNSNDRGSRLRLLLHSTTTSNDNNNAHFTTSTITTREAEVPLKYVPAPLSPPNGEILTSAVLRISYDGTHFTGWSAANTNNNNNNHSSRTVTSTRRRRRRRGQYSMNSNKTPAGFVRSVEGVLRENLAKLWGNVDPSRIVVEGCSRTDKGVHATGMIAHIYCLKEMDGDDTTTADPTIPPQSLLIPGKQIPHPTTPTDCSCFVPLPQNGNLSKIAFSFNRMRPSDVQITGIAPTPSIVLPNNNNNNNSNTTTTFVFHASLSSVSKTYRYRISTGYNLLYDPIDQHAVWHVAEQRSKSSSTSDVPFLNVDGMRQACQLLQGTHDFAAFRGAPRGEHDKRRYAAQSTICTLSSIQLIEERHPMTDQGTYFVFADPSPPKQYSFVITGDRFLYRMVRRIVGAIVAVGLDQQQLHVSDITRALEIGNWDCIPPHDDANDDDDDDEAEDLGRRCQQQQPRRKEFMCAPAHGLMLESVDYGEDIQFEWQPLRDASSMKPSQ